MKWPIYIWYFFVSNSVFCVISSLIIRLIGRKRVHIFSLYFFTKKMWVLMCGVLSLITFRPVLLVRLHICWINWSLKICCDSELRERNSRIIWCSFYPETHIHILTHLIQKYRPGGNNSYVQCVCVRRIQKKYVVKNTIQKIAAKSILGYTFHQIFFMCLSYFEYAISLTPKYPKALTNLASCQFPGTKIVIVYFYHLKKVVSRIKHFVRICEVVLFYRSIKNCSMLIVRSNAISKIIQSKCFIWTFSINYRKQNTRESRSIITQRCWYVFVYYHLLGSKFKKTNKGNTRPIK